MIEKINHTEKLFKFVLKCQRNHYKPDIHSFMIDISNGTAFVEGRESGVYIEEIYPDKKVQWEGPAVAAVNRLEMLGAKYETINM